MSDCSLPKQPLTCQGGAFPWPHLMQRDSGPPFRPHFPLWADSESGAFYTDTLVAPGEDLFLATLEALGGYVENILDNRVCPQRLEVCDPALAAYLRHRLEGAGIEIWLTDRLPMLEAAAVELTNTVNSEASGPPGPPNLLQKQGMTIERVRASRRRQPRSIVLPRGAVCLIST